MIPFLNFQRTNENNFLRQAVDNTICFAKFNTHGEVISCNQKMAQAFGFDSPDDLVGMRHSELVFLEHSTQKDDFWKKVLNADFQSTTLTLATQNEVSAFLNASYIPIKNKEGELIYVILLGKDNTEKIQKARQFDALRKATDLSYFFVQFDPNGHILDANNLFVEFMGYSHLDEILGEHYSILLTKEDQTSDSCKRFWNRLKEGVSQIGEYKLVTADGRIVMLRSSYTSVKNKKGEVETIIKIGNDITEEKQFKRRTKTLISTIDLSFGFIQFDPYGKILEANKNFSELMGYPDLNKLMGNHHSIFVTEEYAKSEVYKLFWENLRAGKPNKGQFKRIKKTGGEVWIQAAYTPIKNHKGEVTSITKIAVDITAEKEAARKAKRELKEKLFISVSEISTSIGQIADGARIQATKIDKSSESIESNLLSSKGITQKAEGIADAIDGGRKSTLTGSKYVEEMVMHMNALKNTSKSTEGAMEELASNTNQINFILSVMQEIANNTNLLALNASIEAAQAGESGRGFSVIAHEIRMLAENARDSVKKIEEKISSILRGSKNVSDAMKKVMEKIEISKEASIHVQNVFEDILKASEEMENLSSSIALDSNEQKDKLKLLVSNAEDIVVISQETAAATEEVATASKQLEQKILNF